ncbi:MAG: hypothetical protein SNJ84_03675 [Verrucomicrobiia bacterium]
MIFRSSPSQVRGIALPMALVFVVLGTIVVVAFFSRALLNRQVSLSSVGQIKASHLAMTGLETVIGDLVAEIAAGSETITENGVAVFVPRPVTNGGVQSYPGMVPLRIGVDDSAGALGTLIRRSCRNADQYQPAPSPSASGYSALQLRRASPVGTATSTPRRGAPIHPNRWNRPRLMPTSSPGELAPQGPFTPPDWMMVTRAGVGVLADGQPITAASLPQLRDGAAGNPDFALGRIAYTVYDIGGLLDINVAGGMVSGSGDYPALPAEEMARKGSLGFADLRGVPGMLNPDALVRWRNHHSARSDSFSDRSFPAQNAPPYVKFLLDPELNRGHTRVHPGDQAFLGRQDLLRYVAAHPGVITAAALPHLTTFSRAVDAPTWAPSNPRDLNGQLLPRQNNVDYQAQGNASSAEALAGLSNFSAYGWLENRVFPLPNRHPARVIVPPEVTPRVTSIQDWDGNPLKVEPGQMLRIPRFPLSRLDLFRQYEEARKEGRDTSELEKQILYSFGLIPDPAAPSEYGRWLYVRRVYLTASGTNPPDMRLMTLDEVANPKVQAGPNPSNLNSTDPNNVPRLPNFFEILQAAILHGDIGYGPTVLRCNETRLYEILQIGANIIDQYDSDNHPTFLRAYAFRTAFKQERIQNRVLVGKENLPQISEVLLTSYRPVNVEERKNIITVLEFEIWNPHQNAGAWSGPPVELRLSAQQGAAIIRHSIGGSPAVEPFDPDADWLKAEVDFTSSSQFRISFQYPTSGNFADPTLLSGSIPGISNASLIPGVDYGPDGPHQLYGFHISTFELPDNILSPAHERRNNYNSVEVTHVSDDRTPLYELQYLDTRSTPPIWKTYNTLSHPKSGKGLSYSFINNGQRRYFPGSSTPDYSLIPNGRPFTQSGQRVAAWGLIDPRRSRFEVMGENPTVPTPGASVRLRPNKNPYISRQYFRSEARDFSVIGGVRIPSQHSNDHYPDDLVDNTGLTASPSWFMQGYDGIRRLTDASAANGILPTTNAAMNWFLNNLASNPAQSGFNSSEVSAERLRDRSVHLNRPFRSVAELGYVFAEQPWKTLDFRSHLSPHSGLLDWFTLNDPDPRDPVVAGLINLNTISTTTLEAILMGAGKNPLQVGERFSGAEATSLAALVQEAIRREGPFQSRSDLIAALDRAAGGGARPGFPLRKTEREALIRALGSAVDTRTWVLFIDLIAQSGRLQPDASDLSQFIIQGERRVWLSVAIDRFTGEVVSRNLEVVNE